MFWRTSARLFCVAVGEREWRALEVDAVADVVEETGCGLYWELCGGVAAGKSGGSQVCCALQTIAERAGEDFAAPDRCVIAVAGAVVGEAEDAFVPGFAFGQDAGHVRAMMLNGDVFAGQRRRELAASVAGVHVVGDR